MTLRGHSPEHLSTLQIPVEYDAAAQCPEWDRFIGQVLHGCEQLFWETVAYAIVPDSLVQKMLVFFGPGGNGKSTLLRGVEEILGKNNVSNVSLQELASDRFAFAELRGKLANICGDLPARPVNETATIKRLTGGDQLNAQFKYGKPFQFRSFAKLLFSANQLPKVNDTSDGFWDRLLIVPMEKRIRGTGAAESQEVLLARLREPQELSGALNRVLEGRVRLTENKRFSEPPRSRELLDELRGIARPVEQFLLSVTREVSTGQVEPQALRDRYNDWAREQGYPEKTAVQLGKELTKLRSRVRKVRRGPKGDQKYVYEGLELKDVNPDPHPSGSAGSAVDFNLSGKRREK